MRLFRKPSLKKRVAARTSWKRVVRHRMGVKAPRGYGWVTNPKKAAYNRVYNRTTRRVSKKTNKGCGLLVFFMLAGIVALSFGFA